jgi:hypothetical protein
MKKCLSLSAALCLSFVIFFGSQCKHEKIVSDNPYGLPNVGDLQAMGCVLNGNVWISTPMSLGCSLDGDTIIGITGSRPGVYNEELWIAVKLNAGTIQTGVPLNVDNINTDITYGSDSTCNGPDPYRIITANAISGTVTVIKFDTATKVFVGTFSATIPLPGCDTVTITDGRFGDYFTRQ